MKMNRQEIMKTDRILNIQHNTSFKQNDYPTKRDKIVKNISTITSGAAVATAYALIAKKQGFSLNRQKIYNTPIKDWAIFKIYDKKHPERKLISLKEKEILSLAGASVAGGFAGGALADSKKNFKAKAREALNQMLGNVLIPVACVSAVSHLYEKFKPQIISKVPQLKGSTHTIKLLNIALKNIPMAILTIAGLGTGIFTGNKVSNLINEKLYHTKVERKIKKTDFAPHVDDIGMAVSLMGEKSALASIITNTVPFFLCVPGIQTGTAKEA